MGKLFISIPMKGYEEEHILGRMDEIKSKVESVMNNSFQLLTSHMIKEDQIHPVYCLGLALQNMSQADVVVFASHWEEARGCCIERSVCDLYNIDYIEEHELI